jgi:outer membrane biosynthesis protein TonB
VKPVAREEKPEEAAPGDDEDAASPLPIANVGTKVEAGPRPMPRTGERAEMPSLSSAPEGGTVVPFSTAPAAEKKKSRIPPTILVGSALAAAAVVALAFVAVQQEAAEPDAVATLAPAAPMAVESEVAAEQVEQPTRSPPPAASGYDPFARAGAEPEMAADREAVAEAEETSAPEESRLMASEEPVAAAAPTRAVRTEAVRERRAAPRAGTTMRSTPRATNQRAAPSGPPAGAAGTPSREDVQTALRAVQPYVSACRGARGGTVRVNITVASSGRVRNAVVVGDFAGTREGSCVARAVRRARFPEFRRESFSVQYPFQL